MKYEFIFYSAEHVSPRLIKACMGRAITAFYKKENQECTDSNYEYSIINYDWENPAHTKRQTISGLLKSEGYNDHNSQIVLCVWTLSDISNDPFVAINFCKTWSQRIKAIYFLSIDYERAFSEIEDAICDFYGVYLEESERGKTPSNKKYSVWQIQIALQLFHKFKYSVNKVCEVTGIHRSSIYYHLNNLTFASKETLDELDDLNEKELLAFLEKKSH